MLDWILIVNTITALALMVLGVIVFARNPHASLNRIFLIFSGSLIAWIIANYYSNQTGLTIEHALLVNRLTLLFPILVLTSMIMLIARLSRSRFYDKWRLAIIMASLFNAGLSLTPLVVGGVEFRDQVIAISFGWLAVVYFVGIFINSGIVLAILISGIRSRQSTTSDKARLTTIFWCILGTILFALVTNAILPALADLYILTNIGPTSVLLIAGGFYYSITKQQLFNIRPVIARYAGYLLSVTALAFLYGVITFGAVNMLTNISLPLIFEILMSLATGIAALAFPKVKGGFDRVTNDLFYRDAYNPQQLLNEYNKTLVSTVDLDVLARRALGVVSEYMKIQDCSLILGDMSSLGCREISLTGKEFLQSGIDASEFSKLPYYNNIVVADLIKDADTNSRSILQRKDISIVVKLSAGSHVKRMQALGMLLIGMKKSGNPYTEQDIKVVEILADQLAIALQNALRFEEIERFNETLQQRVDTATRKLRETNKKLKELNDSKDDFIGMTSHQLRTPLTSIKGYVSLVMDGDAGTVTKTQQKLLNQAFNSSQKMVYLIADLLNVSRLKTGKFVIERKPTDMSALIKDEIAQLQEEAASHGLELSYKAPKDFPVLPLDDTKTRQVVMNFIDNAIYYTPSGGHIRVELHDLPNSIEFKVTDDGIGVPKAEQRQLFSKFYRAKNAQRARPDGTGLGLYMSRKVVTAQGGAVLFESIEGKGSMFGFMFPKDLPNDRVKLPPQVSNK